MSIDIIENLLGRIQTTQVRSIKENVIARDVGVNSIQKIDPEGFRCVWGSSLKFATNVSSRRYISSMELAIL